MRSVLIALTPIFVVPLTFAQCPGANQVDVNRASAQTLATRGIPATVANAIRKEPLEGYSDLLQLAADNHLQLAPDLVVCRRIAPPPQDNRSDAGAGIDSIGSDEIAAVNVNSSNRDELGSLAACGKSAAQLDNLAASNSTRQTFGTEASFTTWVGQNTGCPGLLFKLMSHGETYAIPRATRRKAGR